MTIPARIVASLLALAAAGAAPRLARATSCAVPELQAPRDGETDVPLDTKLWFAHFTTPVTLRLIGPQGEVPLDIRRTSTPQALEAFVATPRQALAPATSYVFEAACAEKELCFRANRFTTGSRTATAPPLPVIRGEQPFAYDGATFVDLVVRFEFEHRDLMVVVDVAGTSPFLPDQPETAFLGGWGEESLSVGQSVCGQPNVSFPPDPRGGTMDRAPVRFGRLDLAGNFSGWTQARAVVLPPAPGGGCSVGGGGASGWPLALAAILAATVRRRYSQRRSR